MLIAALALLSKDDLRADGPGGMFFDFQLFYSKLQLRLKW